MSFSKIVLYENRNTAGIYRRDRNRSILVQKWRNCNTYSNHFVKVEWDTERPPYPPPLINLIQKKP